MNINVEIDTDTTIYCNVQLITPVIAIGMTGIKGDTGSASNISNAAYDSSWNGDGTNAPSKNAVYDKIESLTTPLTMTNNAIGFSIAGGTTEKTMTVDNSLELAGTDGTKITFPTASKTVMANDGSNLAIGSDADGDIYYRGSGVLARLAKGTAYKHLGMNSDATAPEWQDSANSKLTAQGDILYASAANALARLAIGTANYKLFSNAAGTEPEWGVGLKVISFTHDISVTGDQSITGVGFRPKLILIMGGCVNVAGQAQWSMYDGSTSGDVADISGYAGDNYSIGTFAVGYIWITDATYASAAWKSIDSDGFTITWSKNGSPTGTATFYAACIR